MARTEKPSLASRLSPAADPEASPRQVILDGIHKSFQEPSDYLTTRQLLYILGPHSVGAAILSGAINFAIAVGLYATTKESIHLFQFPNPLLGDAVVTIILQCIITWLIELILVNLDLKNGAIQPVGGYSEPSNPLVRWFLFLDRDNAQPRRHLVFRWIEFVFWQAFRGFIVSVISFALFVGPVIGFLALVGTPSGKDWVYTAALRPGVENWKPMIFKAILGASLGLLTTPLYALFWMMRCGWALVNNGKNYGEKPAT
ncbi:hypothetical protein GGR57DRAFT_464854 [Xylariaceae sp. FL1272]|nr:hypothetical protein GGR57DRAFT_464854 [Xylariaceae sp. FL1272]